MIWLAVWGVLAALYLVFNHACHRKPTPKKER